MPLAKGEKIGAFCLSEPEAGSDATSQSTTAIDMGDHYLLNGTKNWITNGGCASTYLVIAQTDVSKDLDHASVPDHDRGPQPGAGSGRGMGFGMGRGRGMGGGPGAMPGMQEDMATLHAMFGDRDKIKRTVNNLADGAEAITESDDKDIASLLQEHVPAMEHRVLENKPLPPMTFHPIFVELIKHADDYSLTYEETEKGIKVKYQSADPYVIMLVQEHAQLVSRFIKNGMEEIHAPYTLPKKPKPTKASKR